MNYLLSPVSRYTPPPVYSTLQSMSLDSCEEKTDQIYRNQQERWRDSFGKEEMQNIFPRWSGLTSAESEKPSHYQAKEFALRSLHQAKNIQDFTKLCKSFCHLLIAEELFSALVYCLSAPTKEAFKHEKKQDTVKKFANIFKSCISKCSAEKLKQMAFTFSTFAYEDIKYLLSEIANIFQRNMLSYTCIEIEGILSLLNNKDCAITRNKKQAIMRTARKDIRQSVSMRLQSDANSFLSCEILSLLNRLFSITRRKCKLKTLMEHMVRYFMNMCPDLPQKDLLYVRHLYVLVQERQNASFDEKMDWLNKRLIPFENT